MNYHLLGLTINIDLKGFVLEYLEYRAGALFRVIALNRLLQCAVFILVFEFLPLVRHQLIHALYVALHILYVPCLGVNFLLSVCTGTS